MSDADSARSIVDELLPQGQPEAPPTAPALQRGAMQGAPSAMQQPPIQQQSGADRDLVKSIMGEVIPQDQQAPAQDLFAGQVMSSAEAKPILEPTDAFAARIGDDDAKYAPISAQFLASFPTDPLARIKAFSKSLFGDDSNSNLARFGVDRGRVFLMGKDGGANYVEPGVFAWNAPVDSLAGDVGPLMTTAGAIVGGLAGAPFGGVGGAAGATLGAAGADAARQGVANLVGDQKFSPRHVGEEAALAGIGEGLGRGAIWYANRRAAAAGAKALRAPKKAKEIEHLTNLSQQHDIPLTPAEMTNHHSLRAQQRVLQDLPYSQDAIGDFVSKRENESIPNAIHRYLDDMSPDAGDAAKSKFKEAAQGVIEKAKDDRTAATSPMFESAFDAADAAETKIDVSDLARRLDSEIRVSKGDARKALKSARADLNTTIDTPQGEVAVLDDSLPGLHKSHESLAARLKDNSTGNLGSGAANANRLITNVNRVLVKRMEAASPEYKAAMSKFREHSAPLDKLKASLVGTAAKKAETTLSSIPNTVFGGTPEQIEAARRAFESAGKMKEWDGLVRAHLEDAFDKASKDTISGGGRSGAKFRKLLFGNALDQRKLLKALGEKRYKALSNLMDVLQATGRVPSGGSMTAYNQQSIGQLKINSGGFVRGVLGGIRDKDLTAGLATWFDELMLGKHARELAEIITSPDAMKKLSALNGISGGARRRRLIVLQILTQGVAGGGDRLIHSPPSGRVSFRKGDQ